MERNTIFYKDPEAIKAIWLRSVLENPLQYILYRTYTFATFLFPPKDYYYIWQDRIVQNDLGITVKSDRVGETVKVYVTNFGYKYFSFLFEPWFWLSVHVTLLVLSRKVRWNRSIIRALTMSGILYILSFVPTGATIDYRYIYWPVVAGVVALILFILNKTGIKNKYKVKKKLAAEI